MVNFLQSTFTKVLTITLFFTFLGVYAQSTPKVGIAKLIGCGTGSNADKAEVVISVDGNISDYQYNFGSGWVGTNKAWLGVGTHSLQVRKGTKTYPLTITVPPKAVAPNFTSRVIYNCNGTGNVNLTNNQPNYQYSYTYGGVTHSSPYFSSIPVGTHNLTVNYIAPAPSNAKEIIFYDDFGKYEGGPKAVKSPYANPNVYFAPLNKTHVLNGTVYPGRTLATDYCYTVARMTDADYTNAQNHNVWLLPHDKDKDPDGRVMYYNSIVQPDKEVIYKRKATVAPNSHVDFSAFVFNTVKLSSGSSYERAIPSLRLEIYENEAKVAAKAPLYSSYILDVPRVKDGGYDDWYPIGVAANTGNHTELIFVVRMFNQWGYVPSNPNAVALIGNDVALDNILVTQSSQSCPIPQTVPITVAANPNNINATAEYNCTTHKGKITVTPTNTTDYTYTYKLDSGTVQNSNVFNNVSLGAHTVTVTYTDTAKKIIFKEDFGSGSPYLLPSSVVPPPFICKLGGLGYPADVLPEGHYQVANVNNLTPMRSWNWLSPQDHTSNGADSQGRYLAFNYGKNAASHFYLQDLKVEPNKDIRVEYYVYNINNTGVTQFLPNIEVSFINKDNNAPVNINTSGSITGNTNNQDWRKITYTFNPGNATRLQMKFKDTDNDESANDFAIDDILVYQLPDTCTKTIPVTVSNPTPAPTLASTFAFCQAENKKISDIKAITLTNSNWYLSATGGTALADNTLLQTKEYYVSQTISGCESSDRKKVTVTITPTAVAPTVAATQTYCSAENKKVSDLSTIAGIKWYTSATGGTALPSTTVLTSQKYYGAVMANGCESARREVTVTITPTAAAPAVTTTQTYCSAENKKVSDLSTIIGIKWYTSATGGTALAPTTVLTSQKYYGAVTANGCESARQEVTVTITPTAAAPAVAATQTYCSAENKKVSDLSTIAGIKWYTSATGGTALAPTTVLTSQKYYGAVMANGCESARREVTVTIQTSMMITGQPHQATYYKGTSAAAMSVVATGTGPFTYKWFVNTTNSNTGGTQVATTSTFTPPTSVVGIKYYYVEITGACGTVKSKATPIIVTNRVQSDSKTYTGHPSTNSTPTNAGNILTNTKINGVPPTPTEVAISIDTPATPQGSAPVPKINTTTGVVEIPQGTPPGTYTIRYKVCDKATPTTCVITTATVVVTSNAIQAIDDNVSVEKSTADQYVKVGGNDFNVLSNDKLAGVTGVQLSQVDIQTTNTVTGLTIEPATGKVKVSSSVQAGVYTLKYKIKEKGATTSSNEASVTVVVKNKLEVTPVVIPGNPTPSTNNTPKKVANILDGVTLNGHKPNTSEVTISESTPATPKHTGAAVPKVQSNGDVVIPKGTPDGTYTIKYKVCDKAPGAAQTCKEATITIHVGKNHIKANDDDYSASPIEKSNTSTFVKDSGGNEVNVLKNDELTGITTGSLTTNEVEITSVTPSSANVTIDPTTGKVKVAANTPVGNYTITYKIKEKGTDNESAIATVKVAIKNKIEITQTNFSGNPSVNSTPKVVGNILNNTKVDGSKPNASDVVITEKVSAQPKPGGTAAPRINPSTGDVEIPQGTAPGEYNITYEVCDKKTPQACKTQTTKVTVSGNTIQAIDDNVSVEKSTTDQYVKVGGNDFNVLSNDKLAGVTGIQPSQVDIQTTNTVTGLTIEPATGKVKVSSSVQAGVYTLKYKIKEKGGTTYSHEATVTVVVKNKLEVTPVVIPGNPTPSTNNTPKKVANILDGVTLNGHKPNTSEVTISESTPATPKHTGAAVPKVQSNGDVVIPKGTPDGTYTIKYKVCDKAPGAAQTCKEATITIHVGKNHIKANDDDYSASPIEKSNTSTFVEDSGGNEVNVLKNDELTGITTGSLTTNEVEITSVTPSSANVTIDPTTGKVKVAANTPVGNYTITYKIKEKGTDNESAIATVKVAIKNKIEITQTNFSGNPSVNSTPKVVGNILNNTKVDGSKPNAGDVVITEKVSAQPKPGGTAAPRINPSTGDVEIPQGTAPGEYNITYEVCDKKTPQACKTQTTKVTVSGNTIQAIDDDYTSSPVEKGTTIVKNALGTEVNILSNDKLGSVVGLTTSQVDITSVTPSNPKVTIDLTTGKIIVAADTPKGDYTITYKIKEKGSSHESSVATVKVRVINKVEVPTPNNFAGTPSTGTTPNIIGDIITDGNVKINGSTPSINDVTITIDTPATPQGGAPVPRINPTTGKVEIPQGVPNGNYTITYTLCDKGAPQTCKQAVAKVKVGSNALVANDDNKSNNMAPIERSTTATKVKKADGTVANILTNDKIGNKTGLTLTDVTITQTTTNPHISIDTSTGEVNVAANTPAGAYTVGYKLTDKLDSGNVSNEATVTIIVKNKLEVTSITIPNATPSTNNTPKVIGDILDNTKVNGNKPSPSQVVIRVTTPAQPSSPGAPVPSVDTSTGKIMIPKGVKPGNYTITYEVCDKATPADAQTCKTATATITVAGNTIQAIDDDYSNKHVEYSGTTKEVTDGGVAVNILANDKLAGQTGLTASEVTITQVSTTHTGVTIEVATGKVKVAGSTPAGTYTIKYTITEKGGTTASNQATVTVVVRNKVEVSPNEFTGEPSNNATPRVIGNITDNVKINGSKPNPSDVTITIPTPAVPKAPGAPVPSINPSTGDVVIPQGTPAGDYPITVQVCDKATPATCTTQTITVKVKPSSSPFNLVDDIVTLPRAGGSIDVLSNDKLKDGTPIVPANVTVTIANNGGLTGVSVNTDGKVIIPSGTPSGNYEITYKVCNSDGCDTAKVKLTVKRNVIKAIDDDFGRISNATTNTTSQTVFTLGVDTLEGKTGPLSPATDVILTPGISPHSGITMGGDGNITVAQGTPRGAYVYSYTICERGVSGNCSTANAYLEVVDGRIIATDDGVWHVGVTGGLTPSVLDNDKLGSRIGLTASDVSIEKTTGKPAPDSHLEMNSDGRITVKPGIAIGTYIYYYTIINKADPTETAYAKATIEVSTYVAQDDVFDIDNPINQSINTPSVLENDELNGKKNPSPITDVILTPGTSSSTNLVMNADGTITIAPNTPDGTYTYTYTVCQKASPTNCKTGTATIKLHPALVANDDDFSATPVKSLQPTVVGNVLNNAVGGTDTLSGNPITDPTLVQISLANNGGLTGVVINNNGDVTVPQGAISGTYHVTYRICLVSNPSVCKDARVTIVVLNDEPLTFYNGISSNGDGYNDGFIIKNIELYPKNNLKIFNRWGVLVYEKDGYTNTDPFKGYSTGRTTVGKDGKLPQGTYYYILEYLDVNKNTQQKSGWLYLKNE